MYSLSVASCQWNARSAEDGSSSVVLWSSVTLEQRVHSFCYIRNKLSDEVDVVEIWSSTCTHVQCGISRRAMHGA